MSNLLNLTQRQLCEKVAEVMRKSNLLCSGYTDLLTRMLYDSLDHDVIQYDLADFTGTVVNDSLSLNEISTMIPGEITGVIQTAKSVIFRFENTVYDNGNQPLETIQQAIGAGVTWLDFFGNPVMDRIWNNGHNTILSYCRSFYDWGTTHVETDLYMYISGQEYFIAHLSFDANSGKLTCTSMSNENIDRAAGILACVAGGTCMLAEVCQCLADGVHDPASLLAILKNYADSKFADIAQFCKQIIRSGRDTIQETLTAIVQLFRSTFGDYHEDEFGNITWNIVSQPVRSLFWQVAGSILLGGFQVVGTVLLYSGKVIGKIVGGLITVGTSIIQSISSYMGTVTGTNPYVNDDAIDHCYHDPVAQCDNQDISRIVLNDEVKKAFREKNRCKIVTPCCTLYMYNYDEGNGLVSWKLFSNMDSNIPVLNMVKRSGTAITFPVPQYSHGGGAWAQGCVNFAVSNDLSSADRMYGFNCTGNDGHAQKISSQYGWMMVPTSKWTGFFQDMLTSSDATLPVAIKTNSADAANWVSLWNVLRLNTIATLSLAYCNPNFYLDSAHMIDNDHQPDGVDLRPLFYYRAFDNAPGYKNIVNTLVQLSQFDHSHDRFLACVLNSLGLAEVPVSWRPLSLKYKKVMISDANVGVSLTKTVETVAPDFSNLPAYLDDHTGIFPFMSIDPYAYVTPPEYDYKSIIFGALFAGAMIGIVLGGIMLAKNILRKKLQFNMQNKGEQLMQDGEVFKKPFTADEWKQLTPADRATYMKAWKKYNLKVKVYNKIANFLGLDSIDWVNSWWNPYSPSPGMIQTGTIDLANPDGVTAMSEVIDSAGQLNASLSDPSVYATPTDAMVLYRLITGTDPIRN